MNKLQWWQRRIADRLSHLQISVLALLALASVLYFHGHLPRERLLEQVQAEIVDLRKNTLPSFVADVQPDRLPPVETLPDALRGFQQLAADSGVAFVNASYRLEREGDLYRYRINTDVDSPYPALRAFLSQVMSKYPTLSLDRLEIQRGMNPRAPHTILEMSFHFVPSAGSGVAP